MKFIYLLICFASIVSCANSDKDTTPKKEIIDALIKETDSEIKIEIEPETAPIVINLDSLILQTSSTILLSIKEEKWGTFASYIHPTKGVRFSPYAYIDTVKHVVLTQNSFLPSYKEKQLWGFYDGSGDSILLTTRQYFQQFVYDANFFDADKTKINEFIGSGNSLNNLKEIYSNNYFTEHYFLGFIAKYEGMDWTTLRLVFEEYQGSYFLVGIVHDQWTI